MATLDSDIPMVPAGEPSSSAGPSSKKPKRFEIKKWNAVALWAWGKFLRTLTLTLTSPIPSSFLAFLRRIREPRVSILTLCVSFVQILLSITVRSAGTTSWISVSPSFSLSILLHNHYLALIYIFRIFRDFWLLLFVHCLFV